MPAHSPEQEVRTAPMIYFREDQAYPLNWIARGTDGKLYVVPAMPGGWLQREAYRGTSEGLVLLRPEKARSINWYVFGDIDGISIAKTL